MSNDDKNNYDLSNFDESEAIKGKEKHFSEGKFTEKFLRYAKKIGVKTAYYSLLLFYAFKSPETPKKAKLTIAGALGYLILPVDAIPDFIPVVGFTDDAAVIVYAVYQIISHIDEKVKNRAHQQMVKLFGENYDENAQMDEKFKPGS